MNNINTFKTIVSKIMIIVSIIEICCFFSYTICLIVFFSLSIWFIAKNILFTNYNLFNFPLSTFMLIGYVLFFAVLPIPATLLEFKPVDFNLKNPIETFFNIFLLFVVIMLSFLFYKNSIGKHNIVRMILSKSSFFDKISVKEVFVLSLVALIGVGINILVYGQWEEADMATDKPYWLELISNFSVFLSLPIILLFPSYGIFKNNQTGKKYTKIVFFYVAIVFVIGIASNVRTMAISCVTLFLGLFFYAYLAEKIRIVTKKKYIYAILFGIWFFLGPFADISTAMVIVRGEKTGISGMEMLEKTWDMYQNKDELRRYKILLSKISNIRTNNDWDETYLDNDLLARFCSVKTIDETIYYSNKIGHANERMIADYKSQLIAMLPGSITPLFGMSLSEREKYKSYSETDYLYSLASGSTSGLGSFIIGSVEGIGLSLFGYWYLAVAFFMYLALYYLFDSTVLVRRNQQNFSVWALLSIYAAFYMTSCGHNFHTEPRYIVRGFIESIIVYSLCRYFYKKIFA